MATDTLVDTPPGWLAQLSLGFARRGDKTALVHSQRQGPLTVQRPFHPGDGACHVYLLHPPGGVVGGDRLELDVAVEPGAHALITTPGAAKFYRSAGPLAHQQQTLRIDDGGVLEWLPMENILFPGARLAAQTRIELTGDARFLGWEIQALGRPVIDERFTPGNADLQIGLWRDGRPLLLDRLRIEQEAGLDGPAGLRGRPISATLIATAADPVDLDSARAAQAAENLDWGVTLLDDLLVARILGDRVEPVQRLLVQIWKALRSRLMNAPPVPPRIWAT